jgi:hypothetical protein
MNHDGPFFWSLPAALRPVYLALVPAARFSLAALSQRFRIDEVDVGAVATVRVIAAGSRVQCEYVARNFYVLDAS